MNSEKTHKIFILFLQIAIVSCAISVSLSQLFLFLTLVLYLLLKGYKSFRLTSISLLALGIFILYALSFLLHTPRSDPWTYLISIKGTEFKDVLLFGAFLVMQNLRDSEDRKKIEKAFWILLVVLLVTGFVSVFSQIRLSRLISDLFKPSANWKFAHHYGDLLGVGIHLPIGLMNTHLTYAGILLLFAPFVFFRFIFAVRDRNGYLFHFLVLVVFGFIAILNNARSALIGAAFSILIGYIDLILVQRYISWKKTLKLISILFLGIGIIASSLFFNETMAKTIQPLLGQEKHTDSGRTFIWSSTYPMIMSNPILGIGPGNYGKEVELVRKQLSEKYKELLFFFEVTQRGHAHNDFLHIAAISGLPAMCFYILLGSVICYKLLEDKSSRSANILFYGLVGFFISGLFQCYFQDDEVVIVFWYLLGFFHLQVNNPKEEIRSTTSI